MHHPISEPSPWVVRWASLLKPGGSVLDLASGSGRHARFFAARGQRVTAVDRDGVALAALQDIPGIETLRADIERDAWPLRGRDFDAVVVTNYLHRPLWPDLLAAVGVDGVLLYETFMEGNARYGKPSNPDFLLRPGELLEAVKGMAVVAFEQGVVEQRAVVQRICARRGGVAEVPLY